MNPVYIYTDGACSGNPGHGGFAAILTMNGTSNKEISAFVPYTTNNVMELKAVIAGLSALKKDGVDVIIRSDSKYVTDAFNKGWITNWEKNGWKTAGKKPVAHKDLWEKLIALVSKHNVTFEHVDGHKGDFLNERADALARCAIEEFRATSGYEDKARSIHKDPAKRYERKLLRGY